MLLKCIKNKKMVIAATGSLFFTAVGLLMLMPSDPSSSEGMLESAKRLEDKGKISLALEEYSKLVRKYPDYYEGHMRLAYIYKKVKEPEKAKIEFFRAIELKTKNYEANFELADMYVKQGNFELAEEILKPVQMSSRKNDLKKLGLFYFEWARFITAIDLPEAIRKIKLARVYFKKAGSYGKEKADLELAGLYGEIADKLVSVGKTQDALDVLHISLKFSENAVAYYKLALIYKEMDPDKSMEYFEKAFTLDENVAARDVYISLLNKKADSLKSKGKDKLAKFYYAKAYKVGHSGKLPFWAQENVFVNILGVNYSQNLEKDSLTPGVTFRVMNFEKTDIQDLVARVVYKEKDSVIDEQDIEVANMEKPLASYESTIPISVAASIPLNNLLTDHTIKIEVYMSRDHGESWDLYRTTSLHWDSAVRYE